MPETSRTRYEIVIRGRAGERVLHPIADDLAIEARSGDGEGGATTRLVGEIRDPSHLHGVLAHLTSMNVEIVLVRALAADPGTQDPPHLREGTPR